MIKRELNLAKKYIEKYNIIPPVNIHKEVKKYAKITEVFDFPVGGVDAILLKSRDSEKYEIILNGNLSIERKRFTLAHELGHIVMPWHQGTFACVTDDGTFVVDDMESERIEAEANRFAAELLVPTRWASCLYNTIGDDIVGILNEIQSKCRVSLHAAFLSLEKVLPPKYLVTLTNRHTSEVIYSIKSKGVKVDFPIVNKTVGKFGSVYLNKNVDLSLLKSKIKNHTDSGERSLNGCLVSWWVYDYGDDYNDDGFEIISSKKLLKTILDDCGYMENKKRQSVAGRISGITGSPVWSQTAKTEGELYSLMRQNFFSRDDEIKEITKHEKFDLFLKNKARELFEKLSDASDS